MSGAILKTFKRSIHEFTLIPASGGCFELSVNGQLIYSKLAIGKFPEEPAIIEALRTFVR